jgi:hypothetical protein
VDKLAEFLSSDRPTREVAPETLELLGKQAANAYLERGTAPNTTILKLAAENELGPDHVRRVVESTNTAIHLHQHEKNKTAGETSSYPQFTLADAEAVLAAMEKKASPDITPSKDSSYQHRPRSRAAEQREEKERRLDELFSYRPNTWEQMPEWSKTASLDFTAESALTDLTATKDQLKGIKDNLTYVANNHDAILKEAEDEYFRHVRAHLLEGGSFADVMIAARSTNVGDEKIAGVLSPMVERIIKEKVAGANRLQAGLRDMEKVANRVVNPQHPLVDLFKTIVDAQDVIEKAASDLRNIEEDLDSVNEVIKGSIRARTAQ